MFHVHAVEHTDCGCYREKGEDWDANYPGMRKLERFVPTVVRIVEVHAYRPADDDRDGKSCNSEQGDEPVIARPGYDDSKTLI